MTRQVAIPCSACGRKFGGQQTLDRHKHIAGDQWRCRSDEELRSRGFYRDLWGVWHRGPNPDQGSLLGLSEPVKDTNPRTIVRTTDPITSQIAARAVSYRTGTQKARLLQAYLSEPEGLTDDEAGMRVGLPQAWKRCSDLRNDGVIEPVGTRPGLHGTPVMVCRAVSQEKSA